MFPSCGYIMEMCWDISHLMLGTTALLIGARDEDDPPGRLLGSWLTCLFPLVSECWSCVEP